MRLTKQIFAFAITAMLLSGCGGSKGNHTGKKTSFAELEAAVNALPAADSHPYTNFDGYYGGQNGEESFKEEIHCIYQDGEWLDAEKGTPYSLIFNTAKEFLAEAKQNDYEHKPDFKEIDFYVNPLSFKAVEEINKDDVAYDITTILVWDDPYGLPTYYEASATVEGTYECEKCEATYSTKKQTSQGGGEVTTEITPQQLLDEVQNEHPYTKATMTSNITATYGGQSQTQTIVNHFVYTDEYGWQTDESLGYMPLSSCTAQYFVGSFIEAGAESQGYSIKCYKNPYRAYVTYESNGSTITIDMTYNQYGLPTAITQIQASSQYTAKAEVTVTYQ